MARAVGIGLLFMAVLAFAVAGPAIVILDRLRGRAAVPAFVAAAFLAPPYAHFAFSRADPSHLAQGIFPLLVGALSILAGRSGYGRQAATVVLALASYLLVSPMHPYDSCRKAGRCESVRISGDEVWVRSSRARTIAAIRDVVATHAPDGGSFLAAPLWPGAYPLMGRRAPNWEIYALFPRSEAFERREIDRIRAADPGLAILRDVARDGRDDFRFRNTHPHIQAYIDETFEMVESPLGMDVQVLVKKADGQ